LSGHVPVRFSPSLVLAVKALADFDGVTVSTWIRGLVTREIERRRPPVTMPADDIAMSWETPPSGSGSVGETVSSGAHALLALAT
jgi:hypothetical protein